MKKSAYELKKFYRDPQSGVIILTYKNRIDKKVEIITKKHDGILPSDALCPLRMEFFKKKLVEFENACDASVSNEF